ncbi:MAG TPA: hypothetical protein V6D06_01980 [Trichocoleus sp.]
MSDDSTALIRSHQKPRLSDRIRSIASQLREESDLQIKATSRILGAAAQIAQNHDRLIEEVVEVVEEDLAQAEAQTVEPYTEEQLKSQFKRLKDATAHFGIEANKWAALVDKLNAPNASASGKKNSPAKDSLVPRLESIESEIRALRGDVDKVIDLLTLLVEMAQK